MAGPFTGDSQVGEICCACRKPIKGGKSLRFPRNPDLRKTWVDIVMANITPFTGLWEELNSTGVAICLDHFDPKVIFYPDAKRSGYGIQKGGVPTIFNGVSSVCKSENQVNRSVDDKSDDGDIEICYDGRSNEVDTSLLDFKDTVSSLENDTVDDLKSFGTSELYDSAIKPENDPIKSLDEFRMSLKQKEDKYFEPWKILYFEDSVLFCLFDKHCKNLVQSFSVNENLKVSVNFHGEPFPETDLIKVLGDGLEMDSWSKFKMLIKRLHRSLTEQLSVHSKLKHVCRLLGECADEGKKLNYPDADIKKWKFNQNQIEMNANKNRDFSDDNMQWAYSLYSVNMRGYIKIFESDVLTVPWPAAIQAYKKKVEDEQMQAAKRRLIRPNNVSPYIKPKVPKAVNMAANGNVPGKQSTSVAPVGVKQNGTVIDVDDDIIFEN